MEKFDDYKPYGILSSDINIKHEEVDLGELKFFEEEDEMPIILETKEIKSILEKGEVQGHQLKKEEPNDLEKEGESGLLEKGEVFPAEVKPVIKVDNESYNLEKGESLLREDKDLKYSKVNQNLETQELSDSSLEIEDSGRGKTCNKKAIARDNVRYYNFF